MEKILKKYSHIKKINKIFINFIDFFIWELLFLIAIFKGNWMECMNWINLKLRTRCYFLK